MLKYFFYQFAVVFIPVGLIASVFFGLVSGINDIGGVVTHVFLAGLAYAALMVLIKHFADKNGDADSD